jgi:sulfoxide reductase heme-binding subunit YedZ
MIYAVKQENRIPWYRKLFKNSRFWILSSLVVVSINIAGYIEYLLPPGLLQTSRIEQTFGFISVFLLYIALLASPLTKVFPRLPLKEHYLHARRAIGVSAFYYAFLHVYISFFDQLGGFRGLGFFDFTYNLSFVLGILALGVMFIMAATSFDWIVDHMGYKKWKLLHRLIYIGSIALLIHVTLIGPHFETITVLSVITYGAALFLLVMECLRIRINMRNKKVQKVSKHA